MTIRKCIYTNKEAKSKDSTIPKHLLGEEIHNWAIQVPANTDYLTQKKDRIPTELEMQANEIFHLLELSRARVVFYEAKLASIQEQILKDYKELPKSEKPKSEKIKEKQIEQALAEKVIQDNIPSLDEVIKKRKRNLFEDEE